MYKPQTLENLFEHSLELIFLGLVFIAIFFQLLLGNENIISLLLRHICVAGMMFLAGYYSSKSPDNNRLLFKKGIFYILFFLFFGLLHQVMIYHNNMFWSLARLVALLRIPEPSDIFFTIGVIFLVSSAVNRKMYHAAIPKKSAIIASLLLLAVTFIPDTWFDYQIIGVFVGMDDYNCIPLLPFTGFYLAGYYTYRSYTDFSKKHLLITGIITVISALICLSPLKEPGYITLTALPVYIIFIFSKHCQWYQKLVSFIFQIPMKLTSKIYHLFYDSYGKLRKTIPVYITIYTFFFCILAVLVFSPFWIEGSSLVWDGDALSQYVPKSYYYMDYVQTLLKELLHGNFNLSTYDFQIGLGGPVTFNTEPLFLLLALFPASKVEFAYGFISLLRLYLAGLSASALFLYFRKSHYDALFGSLIYVFSGFALYSVVIHAQFISPMILFPLLIIATEEIFQKNRWYLCTVFVAISLLSNYYFAYMNTLAIGLYFLIRFMFTKDTEKKNIRYFLSAAGLFAGSYLLGVLLGNLSLFTSFASYLGSGRTGSTIASTSSLFSYGERLPLKFFISLIAPPGNTGFSSKYGFIPLVFIALVVLFLEHENKILKFMVILYTAFCMFPFAGLVFSGFSVVINRWGFMYALLIAFVTITMLPKLRTLTKRDLGILFLAIVPYVYFLTFDDEYAVETAPVAVYILLISFIIIMFMNENLEIISKKHIKPALLILCVISIIINSHLQYSVGEENDTLVPDNFVSQGDVLKEIKDTSLSAAETISDNSFYRVASTNIKTKNLNSSLLMDFNGINIFASTVDGGFVDFNREMENSTWSMILYKGFDNRTFLNTLANVKYFTTDEKYEAFIPYGYKHIEDVTVSKKDYSIYENEYALPIGYTYSTTVSEEELSTYPALKQQEILLQVASVSDNSSSTKVAVTSIPTTAQEIELVDYKASEGIEFGDNELLITEEDAKLTLYFEALPDSETYIEFDGYYYTENGSRSNALDFDIIRNDDEEYSYIQRTKDNTYTTSQDVYLYNLGYHEDSLKSCTIKFKDLGSLSYDSVKLYSQPMKSYSEQVNALKTDILENVEMTYNTVKGTISLSEEKLLVMGIPYQNGWTAYVDGKETKIQKVNYMFSGLFLEPGEHSIEFRYKLPGIKLSLILTGIGIIIFITALTVRYKKRKH